MGGAIDWAGLPMLAAFAGIDDIEMLVVWMTSIRTHSAAAAQAERDG